MLVQINCCTCWMLIQLQWKTLGFFLIHFVHRTSPLMHIHTFFKNLNLFWQECVKHTVFEWESLLRASPRMLSMQPCTKISNIQALVINFFPTPPIKLKWRLKACGRLLIATHLDQSNYLANEKQGAVKSYDLIVSKKLLQGSSWAVKAVRFSGLSSGFTGSNSWTSSKISTAGPHTEHWWRCSTVR